MTDLFTEIVPLAEQHRNFKIVAKEKSYSAARNMLNKVFNSVKAIDKDFVKQFQSNGFDARIWEIYLTAVFLDLGFSINREKDRPDFILKKGEKNICIEAGTSHAENNQPLEEKLDILSRIEPADFENYIIKLRGLSTIRIAGVLFNKLKKNY